MNGWYDAMQSWYVDGPDGLHFNWSRHPTFECPNADAACDGVRPTRPQLVAASNAMGADPQMLARAPSSRHSPYEYGRLRVDGKLTDRCSFCGTKMTRKGYRAWIDKPSPDTCPSTAVPARLGLDGLRSTLRSTWHPTKTAAEAWARHELVRAMSRYKP